MSKINKRNLNYAERKAIKDLVATDPAGYALMPGIEFFSLAKSLVGNDYEMSYDTAVSARRRALQELAGIPLATGKSPREIRLEETVEQLKSMIATLRNGTAAEQEKPTNTALQIALEQRGMNFAGLSRESGVSQAQVGRIAKGWAKPSFQSARRIAAALDMEVEELWDLDDIA